MRALFLSPLLFLALVPFAGATDPPAPRPAPTPRIVVAPGGQQPTPAPSPTPVPPSPIPTSIKLSGMECEFLTLTGAGTTAVTWDVTSPDSFVVPVKLFECKPKSSIPAWRVGATEPQAYDVGDLPTVQVFAVNTGRATLAAWGVEGGKPVKLATFAIEANRGPQPPPDPGPGPNPPPDPKPVVVTSFRVILVYESGDTLTAAQNSVLYGKAVEDFLNANCTGGKAGWRRRDKDASSVNDPPMSVVWAAVKGEFAPPKNTKVPAVVIQVNDKITIEPLAATPAEMIATLKKYAEGK